jgi:hypothetical protein
VQTSSSCGLEETLKFLALSGSIESLICFFQSLFLRAKDISLSHSNALSGIFTMSAA